MLHIECFDPHEPFLTSSHYRDQYGAAASEGVEWPAYAEVTQDEAAVAATRQTYAALASMCDRSLGRCWTSLYQIAAGVPIAPDILRAVADDLSVLG